MLSFLVLPLLGCFSIIILQNKTFFLNFDIKIDLKTVQENRFL